MEKVWLYDRQIIEISGQDRYIFLQGLVTNDVFQIKSTNNAIYSAMLSPKGRFFYDFFIFENNNSIYIDCYQSRAEEVARKLNLYKLRSDIKVVLNDKIFVFWLKEQERSIDIDNNNLIFADPRSRKMGHRLYCIDDKEYHKNSMPYHKMRIMNKIPESEYDLTYDKSLILEFGFDNLNAINYEKGCYMGQELTARTHHTGQVRKRIHTIEINDCDKVFSNQELKQVANQTNLLKNTNITYSDKSSGLLLSAVIDNNKMLALALIRDLGDEIKAGFNGLKINNYPLKIL